VGDEVLAPLADGNGRSQCYSCRHWDWAIQIGLTAWVHVCNSPIESLTPGDCVINCEGYEHSHKRFGVNVSADGIIGE
jgi:hypothetical protein